MNAQHASKGSKKSKAETLAAGLGGPLPKASPKPAVAEVDAQAFEGKTGQATAGAAPKVPAVPKRGRTRRDLKVEDSMRLTAYVPIELMMRIRMRCAAELLSLSEVVTTALETWAADTSKGKGSSK